MTFILRPYQQRCVDAVVKHITTRLDSCVVNAAPAAGKSFMVAGIAKYINEKSGKKILCLAPTKELVEQNVEKYRLTGEPCSVFSASNNQKSTRHPVVFGMPLSVKNSVSRFCNGDFAAIVIDECHGITSTIQYIIDKMIEGNPNTRVIGLSGTCYRMGTGYIYRVDENDKPLSDTVSRDPYFSKLVCTVPAKEMLDQGYLTPMVIGSTMASSYDTSNLKHGKDGSFTNKSLETAFVGMGRKTAAIVADVVAQAQFRQGGVMLFAATRQHAAEIMASLPPDNSVMVTGDMSSGDRDKNIKLFLSHQRRYIVSVGILTTGFDSPWVSMIALLRKTESAALLQQMLGRAWRLYKGKTESLLLDYAGNIEAHFPDGDIYSPEIKASQFGEGNGTLKCLCPDCGSENEFSARKNDEQYEYDENGYFIDLEGNRITENKIEYPAHYGRRCLGIVKVGLGKYDQCGYRWSGKDCPSCGEGNDIAARYCTSCKAEIIDPNDKLIAEFKAMVRSPYNRQCNEIEEIDWNDSITQSGKECWRINITTPYRSFTIWIMKSPSNNIQQHQYDMWTALRGDKPKTVEYLKEQSGFYRIISWNKPEDKEPEK